MADEGATTLPVGDDRTAVLVRREDTLDTLPALARAPRSESARTHPDVKRAAVHDRDRRSLVLLVLVAAAAVLLVVLWYTGQGRS